MCRVKHQLLRLGYVHSLGQSFHVRQVVVVILATLVTYLFDWEHTADLKILGEIPSGLPAFRLPSFPHVSYTTYGVQGATVGVRVCVLYSSRR